MKTLFVITILLTVLLNVPLAAVAQEGPDAIIIPHGTHFENDLACTDCHVDVEESRSALVSLRPDMDVCGDCHEIDDDDSCTMCHTNPDEAGDYQRAVFGAENFAHAAHLAAGMACATCHGDPTGKPQTTMVKSDCRACHETANDYADCFMCHAADKELVPASHATRWSQTHGAWAREDQNACYLCHTETTCQECHSGDNVRPRSHTLNWAFGHAATARGNEMECYVCHTEPDYCSSCHAAARVYPRSHSQVGWVRQPDGGQHAIDGVFELEDCIACHSEGRDAPTCARCHGG